MHRLGDVVDVRLVEAQPVAGALRFELLTEADVLVPRHRRREGPKARESVRGRLKSEAKKGKEATSKRAKAGTRSKRQKNAKPKTKRKSGTSKKGKSWTP